MNFIEIVFSVLAINEVILITYTRECTYMKEHNPFTILHSLSIYGKTPNHFSTKIIALSGPVYKILWEARGHTAPSLIGALW